MRGRPAIWMHTLLDPKALLLNCAVLYTRITLDSSSASHMLLVVFTKIMICFLPSPLHSLSPTFWCPVTHTWLAWEERFPDPWWEKKACLLPCSKSHKCDLAVTVWAIWYIVGIILSVFFYVMWKNYLLSCVQEFLTWDPEMTLGTDCLFPGEGFHPVL